MNGTIYGWMISNGTGWNRYKTADALEQLHFEERLPVPPAGFAVLVAPVSDKPLGLRIALVEISEEPGDDESQWAFQCFGLHATIIRSVAEPQESADSSRFAVQEMTVAIEAL